MTEEPAKPHELVETESRLAKSRRDIESKEKELLELREELCVAEQGEIDRRHAAGLEAAGFEPTAEMKTAMKAISNAESALSLLRLRESQHRARTRKIEFDILETELAETSKTAVELQRREEELSTELSRVREELAAAQDKAAELADRIVQRPDVPPE